MAKFMKTHGETIVVVAGSGEFPLDMLRYDSACPFSEPDSYAIAKDGPRVITLRRFILEKGREPTMGRWTSFGWRVVWTGDREVYTANRDDILVLARGK